MKKITAGGTAIKRTTEQKNIIRVTVITSFITTFMGSALNLSIPDIELDFQVSAAAVGWVVTVYMLACATLAVPFGRIADIFERKRILWSGILIFACASFVAALSKTMWMLLALRLLQGLGASMIFSTNVAILIAGVSEEERGKVLGYSTCATYVGLSAGPVVGGILNYNFGWRSIFIATAVVSFCAFLLALKRLPNEKNPEHRSCKDFDIKGNALFICAIALTMYGLSTITEGLIKVCIFIFGIGLFILFIINERKVDNPVIKVNMFKDNLSYALSNFAALLNYGATFANSYLLSIYLQVVKDYSSQKAGLVLITATVVQALLSPVFGRISDKKSPYVMSSLGMGLCAIALAALGFLPKDASVVWIMIILFVTGFGFALFASPNTNAVMSSVKKEDYGVASSILATMRSIGHTSSMAIVTMVVSIYLGNRSLYSADVQELMTTMHTAFFIFTGLCIAGIFMALKRKV